MVTSANTSVNKRVPALFNKLTKYDYIGSVGTMLDYGCGKYPDYVKSWGKQNGIFVYSYDKYNFPNNNAKKYNCYDAVALSNVLNVIQYSQDRRAVLIECKKCLVSDCRLFITVYEGDKTGNGRITRFDCWQENRLLSTYLDECKKRIRMEKC